MRTALVTGCTGFLGSALCRSLQVRGWKVVGLSRGTEGNGTLPGHHLCFDLGRNGERLSFPSGIDMVFHLAAKAHAVAETPAEEGDYDRIILEGTRQVVRAAVEARAGGIVYVSSVKVFGDQQQRVDRALVEEDEPNPDTPYGKSKLKAEAVVLEAFSLAHRVVVRPSLVYGPGVKGNLARMWRAVELGRFPPLPETGRLRSLVHRDDLCLALLSSAESGRANGRVFQVTDGFPISVRGMLDSMRRAQGRRPAQWSIPMSALRAAAWGGDQIGRWRGRRFALDSVALAKLVGPAWFEGKRITEVLGWKASRTFADGVRDLGLPSGDPR